jgi:hypothetical protein
MSNMLQKVSEMMILIGNSMHQMSMVLQGTFSVGWDIFLWGVLGSLLGRCWVAAGSLLGHCWVAAGSLPLCRLGRWVAGSFGEKYSIKTIPIF